MPLEIKRHANGYFYVLGTVTVWRDGQSHSIDVRKSTKTKDERQAEGIRRQIENQVAEQNITGKEPALTFRQAVTVYLRKGGSDRFLDKPKAYFGNTPIDQITQNMIDDKGLEEYANPATRRRQFHTPIIAVLRANGLRPAIDRPKGGNERTFFLTPDQAVECIGHIQASRYPNPWTPALFTFLFGQGSRVGETVAIDGKTDISLEHKYAILRDTKNGREKMVTLCPRVIAALTTLPNLGQRGPLFLRYDGRPYEARDERGYKFTAWNRAIKEMGLSAADYTPHITRHSWATWFYSRTLDVMRLRKEGGWESGQWQRYVKLASPSLGKRAAALGFIAGEKNEARSIFAKISL